MKEKIIQKAQELFLNLGFKSVTMDDIAKEMGISKKTIYVHFCNKSKLVKATTVHISEKISEGIKTICELKKNPIDEIFEIKHFVLKELKNEKSSPQFQLQKYYPKIYKTLKCDQYEVVEHFIITNLERGINLGLYRENLNIEFITKMYYSGMMTIKNTELFPLQNFSMQMLMHNHLEYHLRGVCTIKGLEKLEQTLKINQL